MLQGFQFAIRLIRKRPLRMGLTFLQIAVGVAAVTIVLSFVFNMLGSGVAGSNLEGVYWATAEGKMDRNGENVQVTTSFFSPQVVADLKQRSNYLEELAIVDRSYRGILKVNDLQYQYQLGYWVGDEYDEMMNLELAQGSFFTEKDSQQENRVVLISDTVSKQLFGEESALGRTILHSARRDSGQFQELEIIGVYKDSGDSMMSAYNNPHLLLPLGLRGQQGGFMSMLAQFKPGKVSQGKDELDMLFRHEFAESEQQASLQKDTFALKFSKQEDLGQKVRNDIGKTFGLFIGSFAFVALVVSSIGILSMMLVSIVERTREIGLRRALGATRLSIIGQVISEAIMVSLFGGVLGIILAYVGMGPIIKELVMKYLLQGRIDVEIHVSLYAILIALCSVVVVGLIAGIYPGIQAARLAPLEAVKDGRNA